MLTKTKLALAALLMLGIASAAQAGGRDDADHSGGFRTGPLGNDFTSGVNPADHPALARGAYASAVRVGHPQPRPRKAASVEAGKKAYGRAALTPVTEPANIMIQDRFYRDSIGE